MIIGMVLFAATSQLQKPDSGFGDHQCRGVSVAPPEDPVKNGVCSRNVRPHRGLKGRVRRLGSGGEAK